MLPMLIASFSYIRMEGRRFHYWSWSHEASRGLTKSQMLRENPPVKAHLAFSSDCEKSIDYTARWVEVFLTAANEK